MIHAGRALSNTPLWLQACKELTAEGIPIAPFVTRSIRDGHIDVFNNSWTNRDPKNISFRGAHYDSLDQLLAASLKNGVSIGQNLPRLKLELDRLRKAGAVAQVSASDALSEDSVINPIQFFSKVRPDGSIKERLIVHAKLNVTFSKPTLKMPIIAEEFNHLAQEESITKCDQVDCFYQYRISPASARKLRFCVDWEEGKLFYEIRCLAMGLSASSFIVQHINEVLVNLFTLRHKCYCRVFSDDFWHSGAASVDFDSFAEKFGLVFKSSKKEKGSIITILGIQFNLTTKSAVLDPAKAASLAETSKSIADARKVSPSAIASLAGKVEYASQVCLSGRSKTFHIMKCLGDSSWKAFSSREAWLACEDPILDVSVGLEEELRYWACIKQHPPMNIGRRFKKCVSLCSSDASSKKFGYTIGSSYVGGSYPADMADKHIAIKEAYALAYLVRNLKEEGADYFILVDNQAVVSAFVKGRSANAEIHFWINEAKDTLLQLNSKAQVTWISTGKMSVLADAPSRGSFPRDEFGLSPRGAEKILSFSPDLASRRAAGDLVSAFGGPRNNPLGIPYYSIHYDLDDVMCKGREVFAVLEDLAAAGRPCGGGIFAYPPAALVDQFCQQVVRVGLDSDSQVFLLVPGFKFQSVRSAFINLGHLHWSKFSGREAKSWFWKKTGHSMMFFTLSSFDLAKSLQ